MGVWRERLPQATQIAAGVASAAWGRFLCGPVGSVGIARWLRAWVAYAFLALLVSTTALREGPRQVTLWWLFILAWCVSNIASVARAQKRHDPRAWALTALVFIIGGMAIQSTWLMIGLMLLVAAGIHSRPVEWATVLVQRVAHWATAALLWLGAWVLLTNMGVAALEPVMREVNPRGVGALNAGLSTVSAVFNASASLLTLWLLLCGYRRLREQREAA